MVDNNASFNGFVEDASVRGHRPVPLPRKSLLKASAMPNVEENDDIYANVVPIDKKAEKIENSLKRSSRILQEKLKMRNEMLRLEKSIRRMIPKRRSVAPKEREKVDSEEPRSCSLPDSDVFKDISFDSPFNDLTPSQRFALACRESDETNSDTESFYTTSENPPSYPPPPLPDESTYDELTSVSSDGPYSYYSPESDSNSIYEELSNYLSLAAPKPKELVDKKTEYSRCDSWKFYDTAATEGSRYEEIAESQLEQPTLLIPEKSSSTQTSDPKKPEIEPVKDSVVLQFDPLLYSTVDQSIRRKHFNPFEDPLISSFLSDETDSSVRVNSHFSVSSECERLHFELPSTSGAPPLPPPRFDSASTSDLSVNSPPEVPLRKNKDGEKRTSIVRWSSMKRVARFVADNLESTGFGKKSERRGLLGKSLSQENVVNETVESFRGSLYSNVEEEEVYTPLVLNHSGMLFRAGGVKRWGVLGQRKVTIFSSKDSPDVKETIPIDSVLSLRTSPDNKISVEGEQVSCFEVSLSGKSQPVLLGTSSPSERHVWMRKILESVTPAFPPRLALDYDRAGWCFFKEGVSSGWSRSFVLLSQRSLHLCPLNASLLTADLRKARYITLQESDMACKKTSEKGPLLLVDLQDRTLYLQMDTVQETTSWETAVKTAARQNGPGLSQQQLTKDDVPTVVDKCINFVHTHGSVTEGIYRRNGSSSAINKLLSAFRKDAWSVQLTRTEYSEFDVSSVLKRFFRDLPEPLFVTELHQQLRHIVEDAGLSADKKLRRYREVLKQLPQLNFLTARRLMGHLYFIDKLHSKNLMPVENLAAIWGPTLMHVQEGVCLDPNWSRVESTVINDLITHYPSLFDVSEAELLREKKILSVLETFHSNTVGSQMGKKPSGDLKVWVYLNAQDCGDCVSVELPPGKLARELCDELSSKMSLPGHSLCLQEVVSGGQLRRPLHHSECVLEAVLRWGYWPEEDRRDNCLVLLRATILQELHPLITTPLLPAAEELKFADSKTKNFKPFLFELSQTALCYYKDKTCSVKLKEWKLSDIIWYLGHESKRNPHSGWSITFITKDDPPTRTKDKPFFGHTLCGSTEQQKRKWMAAMMIAAHPGGIFPPPVLIE